MNFTRQWWFLPGLLLAAMLIPIWVGRYAPLYDYSNHLLEAQVAAHYADPQFGYLDSYETNPGWYLRSNALSTLLLIGLGRVMPMTVAGHLVLSIYIALFVGGLWLLLRQAGNSWPLFLLAPTLIYNVSFTSGWLNFCYGTALGLFALVVYLRWQEHNRQRDLLWLAILLLLVYVAHLMAWGLLLIAISAMMAVEQYQLRRHGVLWVAMNSALPLLLFTRPTLAVAILIGPIIWVGSALSRRLRLSPRILIFSAAGISCLAAVVAKVTAPLYQRFIPELDYFEFDKLTFPLRLFTLPHQFLPPNPILIAYNLVLLVLVLVLAGALIWSSVNLPDKSKARWLVAIGMLGILYVVIPTRTPDIWVTEPRVLLFATLIALTGVQLPTVGTRLGRAVTICALSLCLLSIGGTVWYAHRYDQQARAWNEQMDLLVPARRVLMLREKMSPYIGRPTVLGIFKRFYTGEYFSTTYTLEHGGFASRTFNNGPVRPRGTIPIPSYDGPGFRDTHYIAEQCSALRETYDAVLFWGEPDANMIAQLNDCFTAGPRWPNMAIWRHPAEP
jgi:hypothetical protein